MPKYSTDDYYPCKIDMPHQWSARDGGRFFEDGPLAGGFEFWLCCLRCGLWRCDTHGPDGKVIRREYDGIL
jgi:hypothetical protein